MCPFCQAGYVTATGLSHHLERGSCPKAPQLNRDSVYNIVRQRDPHGMISKKLIGWTGESPKYIATELSWNGQWYECPLCHNEYASLRALGQHLSSPQHQQSLYHCPNHKCRNDFTTLAGLVNHLESEVCNFMRFAAVQNNMSTLITSTRMLKL